jgi:transposase
MPILDPGRGRTKKGYAWAIARDDRPWGGTDPPAVVFHYAPGRGAEHPKALLADYQGILQCDGYADYKTLAAANDGITLAFCWSHVRREFIELAKGNTAPIATETLQRIAALYSIEAEIRGKPLEIRQAIRHARSRPLIEALLVWFEIGVRPGSMRQPAAVEVAATGDWIDGPEQERFARGGGGVRPAR